MKTVSKKLLSLLLVAILLVSAVPFQASADGITGTFTATVPGTSTTKTLAISSYTVNLPVGTLPTMADMGITLPDGYVFMGWAIGPNAVIDTDYAPTANFEATAWIAEKNVNIKVYYTLDGGAPQLLTEVTKSYISAKGQTLLSFANDQSADGGAGKLIAAMHAAPLNSHYWWDYKWYDYDSQQLLTDQNDNMLAGRAIFAKLYSAPYTITFNPNGAGASVNPTSAPVQYGHAFGSLPTPTRSGWVFGWWDTNPAGDGTPVFANTVYDGTYDTLYAQWRPEKEVYVRIYVNGDLNTPHPVVRVFGKIEGDNVTQAEVKNIIDGYYHGYTATGVFDEADWNNYKANPSTAIGQAGISVGAGVTNVYVHINNAISGSVASAGSAATTTTTTTTTGTTSTGTSTVVNHSNGNPKTGDNVMIEAAVAVMALAVAAFITLEQLRKRNMI